MTRFVLRLSLSLMLLCLVLIGLAIIAAPQNTEIVAAGRNQDIFLIDLHRDLTFNLTERLETHNHVNPSWSPDGEFLVIQVSETTDFSLENFVMVTLSATGRNATRWEMDSGNVIIPRWSPDGDAIVFWSFQDSHIHLVLLETGESRNLTENSDLADFVTIQPYWSPDGQHVALTASQSGSTDIYVLDINTGASTQLTTHPANDQLPFWSPDGRSIVFLSNQDQDAGEDLFIMNADGTNVRRLTNDAARKYILSWLPDGQRIVYQSLSNINLQFLVLDIETGDISPLVPDLAARGFYMLAWRP